jgi:hypothetical protein
MDIPLAIPECRVARFGEQDEDHIILPVRLDAASGRCPDCGQASRSVHSRSHRHPADLPVSASQTRLRIAERRFYCLNPTCRRDSAAARHPHADAERRTRPVRSGRKPRSAKASASEPPGSEAPLPPARQLAWLLVQPTSVLDESEAAVVRRVEQDDTARAVTGLARRFTALVRAAGKGKPVADDQDAAADIEAWITKARTCEAPAMATFASGLRPTSLPSGLLSRSRGAAARLKDRSTGSSSSSASATDGQASIS